MLNYLNQLELKATDHAQQLRQEAEVERALKGQEKGAWILTFLRISPPRKPVTEPQITPCP